MKFLWKIKWLLERKLKKLNSNIRWSHIWVSLEKSIKKIPKEIRILIFFGFLLWVIFIRLFQLQIVQADDYSQILAWQHFRQSTLEAERWNIFLTDSSWNERKLTENVDLYNIFVDPKFIEDEERFVEILSPILYKHFCELNWLEEPSDKECIRNIENFTENEILPQEESEDFFVEMELDDWEEEEEQVFLDQDMLDDETQDVIDDFTKEDWIDYIQEKLSEMVQWWVRDRNYFWFFENDELLNDMESIWDFVEISGNYIYFIPEKVDNLNRNAQQIFQVFEKHNYSYMLETIRNSLTEREIRYVKVTNDVNSRIAREINELKEKYFSERVDWVPLLHWLWTEEHKERYYPYWDFMSHVIWYWNDQWDFLYGVEEYFDDILAWEDWRIASHSVPWIWAIWSAEMQVEEATHWSDVYLTINPTIQENIEAIVRDYYEELEPDSISTLVMDPHTWEVKWAVNYPSFDPNNYSDYYQIELLSYDQRYIIDEDQYMDIPVLIRDPETDDIRMATFDERTDPNLEKFVFSEKLWPQTFIDRNISYPSEPGSTFKNFTVAIWRDLDEISLSDTYKDEWELEIWPYTIRNVMDQCSWELSFLDALNWSCNVWMVRIAQQIWRYAFYSYLDKLWFWQRTWIELAKEDPWTVTWLEDFSMARYFNNSFGQWLLTTPIQMWTAFSSLVNWWYVVQPTVLDKIYDRENNEIIENDKTIKNRVFSEETAERMLKSQWEIMDMEDEEHLWSMVWIPFYSVWGKSWTSQIAFRWSYQAWEWWTYWGFVWVVTSEDPRYIIVTQVRRPRQSQRWSGSAWFINRDVSKFLIEYAWLER